MHVVLDRVPLRDASLAPEEILMSESQERMCAIVEPRHVERFLAICAKWDVTATVIGEVTDGDRLVVEWHGETVVEVPPRTVAHEGPVYDRPYARPADQDALQADAPDRRAAVPARRPPASCARRCCGWSPRPGLAAKDWVTSQYDRYVQGDTVLAQPEDSGMVRIDERTGPRRRGGHRRQRSLLPRSTRTTGPRLALAEAYRNVATTGARPLAVTNCLNFGSPEDPAVMWQFAEAVRGLADGCLELGVPVTGGNVSFYNQTGDVAILPTPVVGVLGVIDDVARRTPIGFDGRRATCVLLLGVTARRARRLGVGPRGARAPRGPAARGRPARPSGALAEVLVGAARRRAARARPTTCPRAGWPRRWSRWRCGTATGVSRTPARMRSTRSSRCSPSRPGAPSSRSRRSGVDAFHRAVRTAPGPGRPGSASTGGADLALDGLFTVPRRRSCARPRRPRSRPCSADHGAVARVR